MLSRVLLRLPDLKVQPTNGQRVRDIGFPIPKMADELILERNNLGTVATGMAGQARAEAHLKALVHTMHARGVVP
jgi:hypothetical protein